MKTFKNKLWGAVFLLSLLACISLKASSNNPISANSEDDKTIQKIIELAISDNRTMEHLDILTNRFGGRPLGSDAYSNAADWCVSKFKEWGLEVYKQEVGEYQVGFNRGPWFGRLIGGSGGAQGNYVPGIAGVSLHFATPSYTSGTKGIQRGHALKEPKTRAEFERMKRALKGAWVLISGESSGWPIDYTAKGDSIRAEIINKNEAIMKQNAQIEEYNESLEQMKKTEEGRKKLKTLKAKALIPLISEPALFYKEMRDAGILGIIQSARVPIVALYDRKNINTMTFNTLPTLPDIKLDSEQYALISKMIDRREYFQLEFDIRNYFKMGPVKYHNVIGIMRGTDFPNEYVISGGHLDAFDVASGGVDCGSGITPTIEAARLLSASGAKPKRTILFCLWAGEEFGLLGSKFFVENGFTNGNTAGMLANISNYFNRDGGPTVPVGITVTDAMYEDFVKVCAPINKIKNYVENAPRGTKASEYNYFPFEVKRRLTEPRPIPKNAGGGDHAYFLMSGVPTIGFQTADPKGYNFSYGEIWHTERDTYDKSIAEYQEHTSTVNAIVLYGMANVDHLLNRDILFKF